MQADGAKPKKTVFGRYLPLWAGLLYALLQWLNYVIIHAIGLKLMTWCDALLEKHCYCPKCITRSEARGKR